MSDPTEALVTQLEAIRIELRLGFAILTALVGAIKGEGIEQHKLDAMGALTQESDLLAEKARRLARGGQGNGH
jgi:hypothetical protein